MRRTTRQEAIYDRLELLRSRNNGRLTPDDVWRDGQADPASPLHSEFSWDVQKAAENHWRARARQIIEECYVQVRVNLTTFRVPTYVRDQGVSAREQGYAAVAIVKTDREISLESLEYEVRRARAALERARRVALALELPTATVDEMIGELEAMRESFAAREASHGNPQNPQSLQ